MSEKEIEILKEEIGLVKDIVCGPKGKPEESLIVKVNEISGTLKRMNRVLSFIAMGFGGFLLEAIWRLVANN